MSKQFVVYHTEKGEGSGGGLSNHIDRVPGKEHTYKNADPKLKHLNKNLSPPGYENLSIPQGIKKRIAEGYNGKRKIRSDAVKFLSHMFSGSNKQMMKIFSDEKTINHWLQQTYNFAKEEFGKENIIKISLHLDERTPHLHITSVPLTPDGRLSAREIMGNREKMKERQSKYAEMMKDLGLERGIENTGIRRETAQDFSRRVQVADLEIEKLKVRKSDNSIDPVETLLKVTKALKLAKLDLLDPQREAKAKRDKGIGR